jgi:hypothetical protein
MSGLKPDQLNTLIAFAANGDEAAQAFLHKIADFARMTDNIADGDIPSQHMPGAVADQFNHVFVLMGTDPFYDKWRGAFVFLLPVLVILWSCTDEWRKDAHPNMRVTGYVYRESIEFATFVVAYIVGGAAHARRTIQLIVSTTRTVTTETLTDWEQE